MKTKHVPLTRELVQQIAPGATYNTLKGYAVVQGDKPLAMIAAERYGGFYLFSCTFAPGIKPDLLPKKFVWKESLKGIEYLKSLKMPFVVSIRNCEYSNSQRYLEKLGFHAFDVWGQDEAYIWQN